MRLRVAAVLVGCLVVPSTAAASVPCQTALRPGAADVVSRTVLVDGPSHVSAALNGSTGDWDLALFDRDGKAVAAGASPDAQEVASGWASDDLTLQACRLSGPAPRISVDVDPITAQELAAAKADAPQLVSVNTPTRADKDRLTALGLDMSEHGGTKALGVVLHGAADREALRNAGLTYRVLVKDLVKRDAREATATAEATTLPSGHTSYRTLADYESELKALAAANPTFVRLFTLPNKTFGDHDVLGIEIAENVALNDGRPAFVNMGVHHAREWPAGELTMEWAYELINGYKAGDARATNIVRNSRNIVVPIVNPDGFEGSRGAATADANGNDESIDDTAYIASRPSEYRRKNCRVGDTEQASCPLSVGLAENGVDVNRNYGQFWGGPGSDTNPATQTYHGSAPFSEPESRNIQWLVSHNQVMTLITNHTTAGLVLRAPGLAAVGDPVDENNGYKALGDAMAKENGYFSQKGFELYDTTGTTEDWSYNATGGYGFTFELYCGAPNYATGDCDKPSFHPTFATMAKEWDGTSAQADHVGDPAGAYDGKGNREAYYLAAESAIDTARHSLLEGTAPAGTRVKLVKDFKTAAFDPAITVDDHLETIYDVSASGKIDWHVNPSTRPLVAKASGSMNTGPPSAPQTASGSPADTPPTASKDFAFTVPAGGNNAAADFLVKWTSPVSDYDIELFKDSDSDGTLDTGEPSLGSSAQAATDNEQVTAVDPAGAYILRVTNYLGGEPYTVTVTYTAPQPYKAAQVEAYTMTCETGGTITKTAPVVVARGETARVECPGGTGTPDDDTPTTTLPGTPTTPTTATAPTTNPAPPASACAATAGFAAVGFTRRGSGARFTLTQRSAGTATVAVFRVTPSSERRVARFTGKGPFNWGAKGLKDGYYFVRYTLGKDTRRITLRRSGGTFTRVADFYRRASCDLLPSFKLGRPVFRGSLGISYRVARTATVTITVLRGKTVVKRFAARTVNSSGRVTFKTATRGTYTVKLAAKAGTETVTSTLTSRST